MRPLSSRQSDLEHSRQSAAAEQTLDLRQRSTEVAKAAQTCAELAVRTSGAFYLGRTIALISISMSSSTID